MLLPDGFHILSEEQQEQKIEHHPIPEENWVKRE
jgi:hypothetical protein